MKDRFPAKHNSQVSVLKDGLHLQLCSASQISLSNSEAQLSWFRPGQGSFSAAARRGRGQDTGVILHHLTTLLGTRKRGSRSHLTRLCHLWAIHLFCAHSNRCHCYCPFAYFTVVSSKFLFYQPPTFNFCASNSPPQPPAEVRGEGSEWAGTWFGVFWWNTKLGITIPKPWPLQILASFISHFPDVCVHPPHTSSCSSSLREYSSQGSNSPGNVCFTKWRCVAAQQPVVCYKISSPFHLNYTVHFPSRKRIKSTVPWTNP